jgi:hypothetical protein
VLSDREQRVLEELERRFDAEGRGPDASRWSGRRASRPPGARVVAVLGCVSIALLLTGVAAAAVALATATAIGWLFWRAWTLRADGGAGVASLFLGAGHGRSGSGRPPGESIRRCIRWLSEE